MRASDAGPNRDYVRFAIVGQPRCGTAMLVSTLRQHEAVACYFEVFLPTWTFKRGPPGAHEPHRVTRHVAKVYRDLFPLAFIETAVYRGYAPGIRAVGFKMLAHQFRQCRNAVVLERLETDHDIRIVLLSRRDKLKQYLSQRLAARTGHWRATVATKRPEPIELDPRQCADAMARSESTEEWLATTFTGPRVHAISYERLTADLPTELAAIQRHLGLPVRSMLPETKKQRRWAPEELISNYGELRTYFTGTRWERCLEG